VYWNFEGILSIGEVHEDLHKLITNNNSVPLVRERTIPTKRPPLVGEVSANFCGLRVSCGQLLLIKLIEY
jgi:hypothetical protein